MFSRLARLLSPRTTPSKRTGDGRRRRGPRDFQRARLYRWEQEHVLAYDGRELSLAACRDLVHEVFIWAEAPRHRRGWSPPEVTDGRGRRHACGSREVIKLPRWARTCPVVLHECAHGLSADAHGPMFVAVYVELLARFARADPAALRESLERAGVAVAPEAGLQSRR